MSSLVLVLAVLSCCDSSKGESGMKQSWNYEEILYEKALMPGILSIPEKT